MTISATNVVVSFLHLPPLDGSCLARDALNLISPPTSAVGLASHTPLGRLVRVNLVSSPPYVSNATQGGRCATRLATDGSVT